MRSLGRGDRTSLTKVGQDIADSFAVGMPWSEESKQEQRRRLIRVLEQAGASVSEVARRFGVTRQTVYKFVERYRKEGLAGLGDRSRRPNRGAPLKKKWLKRVLGLRSAFPTWGARKLRGKLRMKYPRVCLPDERTLGRWLKQSGLTRRRTHKRHREGLHAGTRPARCVNDVWTIDFKGCFWTKTGSRIDVLTVRDQRSRYLLGVQVMRIGFKPVQRAMQRLFRNYGLPRSIRCDRGAPFCGSGPYGFTQLSLWWHRLGIRVEFVNRKRGTNNNAHENMHGVLKAEVCRERTRQRQIRALLVWRDRFNRSRPHEAHGNLKTPSQVYRPSQRRLPRLRKPTYPSHWLVLHVKPSGNIMVCGRCQTIGRAFAALPVGLFPDSKGGFQVYFDHLKICHLDPSPDAKPLLLPRLKSTKGGGAAPSLHPPHLRR